MDRRYREKGLRVIGLHAPEFDREKVSENVRREVQSLKVTYPVVMDNDFRMWDALENQYWPTIYLIDRKGTIRHVHAGETHEGRPDAVEFERILVSLLAEPA
jgi:alkyl hydroperoxide reductase subunit AhpC